MKTSDRPFRLVLWSQPTLLLVSVLMAWMVEGQTLFAGEAEIVTALKEKGATATESAGKVIGLSVDGSKLIDTDFDQIGKLTDLKTLSVGKIIDDRRLAQLAHLADLESLSTNGATISDKGLEALAGLKKLRGLTFFHPGPGFTGSGLSHFSDVKNLTVGGSSTFGDEGMAAIATMSELEGLRIWHAQPTSEGIKKLVALKKLKSLVLGQRLSSKAPACPNDETLATLSQLKSLESLQLSEARLSFNALQQLKELPSLKRLTLDNVELSDGVLDRLKKELPKVDIKWTEPSSGALKRIGELFGPSPVGSDPSK